MAAAFGTVLQLGVLVFSGFTVHHSALKFEKGGAPVVGYAFPLTAIGTITLVAGMFICSSVVERSTKEEVWITKPRLQNPTIDSVPEEQKGELVTPEVQILWLQRGQPVNDQLFDSFAIFAEGKRHKILTSCRAQQGPFSPKDDGSNSMECTKGELPGLQVYLAILETVVSVVGFVLQFTGLRAMHWSATIAQLAATLVMTTLRAWIRRGLATHLPFQQVPDQYEMEWLATRMAINPKSLWEDRSLIPDGFWGEGCWQWEIDGVEKTECKVLWDSKSWPTSLTEAQQAIKVRERLGNLSKWTGLASELAVSVAISIEVVMNHLTFGTKLDSTNKLVFSIKTQIRNRCAGDINFIVQRMGKGQPWRVDSTEIEAFLSLWLYAAHERENTICVKNTSNQSDWLRQGNLGSRRQSLILLGPSEDILRRDMKWWMNSKISNIVEVKHLDQTSTEAPLESEDLLETVEIDRHRVLGRKDLHLLGEDSSLSLKWECRKALFSSFDYDKLDGHQTPKSQFQLAAISDLPLEKAFTQDLFLGFMYAIAGIACRVRGDAVVHKLDQVDTLSLWDSFKLENSTLSKIVQGIESSGLATSDDALMSIIPPLSINKLLPDIDTLVKVARDKANDSIKVRRLRNAGQVYLELLRIIRERMRKDVAREVKFNKTHRKANALLSEFQILSHASLEVWEAEKIAHIRTSSLYAAISRELEAEYWCFDQGLIWRLYQRLGLAESHIGGLIETWAARVDPVFSRVTELDHLTHSDYIWGCTERHGWAIDGHKYVRYASTLRSISRSLSEFNIDLIGRTPLHYIAASSGSTQAKTRQIYPLLDRVNVNAQDTSGWTALHYCAWNGNIDALKFLLERSAVVWKAGITGITPLHCAAHRGHYEIVKLLLKEGASPNALEISNVTPLHCAARQGYPDIVLALLNENATINSLTIWKESAMHLAAGAGNIEILKILIGKGALKNTKDKHLRTPLHRAAESGGKEAVKLLLDATLDVEALACEYWETPLEIAVRSGQKETVELLLNCGVRLETNDQYLLSLAAEFGKNETVEFFLERGAQINAMHPRHGTPLHCAACPGGKAAIELLFARGAQVDAIDNRGRTPLHRTAICGDREAMELLLARGAQIDAIDDDKKTPFHHAVGHGRKEEMELLLARGAQIDVVDQHKETPLHLAVRYGREGFVDLLLAKGADVNAINQDKETPLHFAAAAGEEKIAKLLLVRGAQADSVSRYWGMPIHCAAVGNGSSLIKLLLAKGVQINSMDQHGGTPLHFAAMFNCDKATKTLLERGAQVDVVNQHGETPLHLAAAAGWREVVKLLLEGGAQIDAVDQNGNTPPRLAAISNVGELMQSWLGERVPGAISDALGGVTDILRENNVNTYKSSRSEVVDLFLERGVQVDVVAGTE